MSVAACEDQLTDWSCERFVDQLAAREPFPGGGGAAALAGALGVALCSMAGNFTVGKRAYRAVEEDLQRILDEARVIQERLLALVNEDARSFEPLAAAYRIPRDDPGRAARVAEATRGACRVPFEIMEQTARAIGLLEEMAEKGSAFMLSDVGCGASLCVSALQAARLTVLVNTVALSGDELAEELDARADAMIAEFMPRAATLLERVTQRLRGGA